MKINSLTITNQLALCFGAWGRNGKLQYSNHVIAVSDVADASKKWCVIRDVQWLGASEAPVVIVIDTTTAEQVAKISYNGRAWGRDGLEISFDGRKTAVQHESEGWKDFKCAS